MSKNPIPAEKISRWPCFLGIAFLPSLGYGEDVRLWGEKAGLAWGGVISEYGKWGGRGESPFMSHGQSANSDNCSCAKSFAQHLARSVAEV